MKALMPLVSHQAALPRPDLAIYVEPTDTRPLHRANRVLHLRDRDHRPNGLFRCSGARRGRAEGNTCCSRCALDALGGSWSTRGVHELVGRSFLLVTSIEGGGLIAVPEQCKLSLIRKLQTREDLDRARKELEAAVRRCDFRSGDQDRLRVSGRPRSRDRGQGFRGRPKSRRYSPAAGDRPPPETGPRTDRWCAVLVGGFVLDRAWESRPSILRRETSVFAIRLRSACRFRRISFRDRGPSGVHRRILRRKT